MPKLGYVRYWPGSLAFLLPGSSLLRRSSCGRGRKRLKSSRRRWLKCQSPRADAGVHRPTRERTSREACRRRSHRCAVSAVAGATDHDSVGRATASCARKQSAPRQGDPVSRLRVQVVRRTTCDCLCDTSVFISSWIFIQLILCCTSSGRP